MMNLNPTPADLTAAALYAEERIANAAEAHVEEFDREYGMDWENNSVEMEYRRFLNPGDVEMVSDADRAGLALILDMEAMHL